MDKMMIFKDAFGRIATIKEVEIYPYFDAKNKVKSYELTLYSIRDNNRIIHLSIYDTLEKAMKQLEDFGCGTFKRQ